MRTTRSSEEALKIGKFTVSSQSFLRKHQSCFPSSGNTEAVSFMRAISPPYLRADSGIVVTNSNDDVGLLVVTFAGRDGAAVLGAPN